MTPWSDDSASLPKFPEPQPFAAGKDHSYSAEEQIPHVSEIDTHVGTSREQPAHTSFTFAS